MNTDPYKDKLAEECRSIEAELGGIGSANPEAAGGWDATAGDFEALAAEPEEQAQKFQELENNEAILSPLELRLRDIKRALGKIESGSYGVCEICDKNIETERLDANAAARTCIEHLEEEKNLP